MSSDLPGVDPATLNEILLYYCLMTKWSGLGDSTEFSRVGWSQCGFGSEKIRESSGEAEEKIGDIRSPPKTHQKNTYIPKPNPLLNKLDTNPDPPTCPHSKNDFQKPIKFISTSGKVFLRKESEKPSEEKLAEKPSGEKPSEHSHPKPKPKVVKFHCDYCGRDGHRSEFCFKRKREERMAKEWANICSLTFSFLNFRWET
jgi:hypothetical protein